MGVYAFAGGKGGVGKTTTALNVGIELSKRGHEVIVADADLGMSDLRRLLSIDPGQGVHDVLAKTVAPSEALIDGPEGIQILPGNEDLDAMQRAEPKKLPAVFDRLSELAEFVLVDTSSNLSHEVLVSIGAADGTFCLTTPKETAIQDTTRTVEVSDHVDGRVLGTVVTRARHDTDVEYIETETGAPVIGAVPEDRAIVDDPVAADGGADRALSGYRGLADVIEACESAEDPVATAESTGEPELPEPQAEVSAAGSTTDSAASPPEESRSVSEVVSGLFSGQ